MPEDAGATERPEPLSPADSAWLRLEAPANSVDVTVVLMLDGPADLSAVRRAVADRLLRHRRFRQRVVDSARSIGRPIWEDDSNFELEHHVVRVELGSPGDDEALRRLVGAIISRPIDLERAPWRLTVVDGYKGRAVLVTQLHHVMGDGFALGRVMLGIADDAPPPGRSEAQTPKPRPPTARQIARLGRALAYLLLLPFERANPLRVRPTGVRRAAWSRAIPLARIKAIGRARGVTVNDVLLAALAGALRRHLLGVGDAAEAPIRAIVPVNLRPVRSIDEMPEALGNEFGLVFLELPVQATSPTDRLSLLHRSMDRVKATPQAIVAFGILRAIGASPRVVEDIVAAIFGRKASLVVTNVPGPPRLLSFAGRKIDDIFFWVPHPAGLGVGVSIMSYAGNVRVGVRADAAALADPGALVGAFEDELGALERVLRGAGAAPRAVEHAP